MSRHDLEGCWATTQEVAFLKSCQEELQKENETLREQLKALKVEVWLCNGTQKKGDAAVENHPSCEEEQLQLVSVENHPSCEEEQFQLNDKETTIRNSFLADTERELGEMQLLPHDTYSFMVFAKLFSPTFLCGILVVATQFTTLILLTMDVFGAGSDGNRMGAPPNVTGNIRVLQIFAFVISVLSQTDVHQSMNILYYGYDDKTLGDAFKVVPSWNRWMLSAVLRLVEGMFALAATFLLVMTEATARDLLLNFTAIEFVSYLDDVVFVLAKWGYLGKMLKKDAIMVVCAERVPGNKKRNFPRSFCVLFTLVGMFAFWGWIFYKQETGQFLCSTVFVQFGDEFLPALGTFSGLYDMRKSSFGGRGATRVEYVERWKGRFSESATLGYCAQESVWTISFGSSFDDVQDPCDWRAKSSPFDPHETDSFDILATSSFPWFTRNRLGREVPMEHVHLSCYDCESDPDFCGGAGHGSCVNNRCECVDGWYGFRCELHEPCPVLEIDTRKDGFLGAREWSDQYSILRSNPEGSMVNVYGRPVYLSDSKFFDIIFFAGRRWVLTFSKLLGQSDRETLADYLTNDFHGHWSNYTAVFLSEPVDVDTTTDVLSSPVGLNWYHASDSSLFSSSITQAASSIQSADLNRPSDAVFFCGICDNATNPCFYKGLCRKDGVCACTNGSKGILCQETPNGNGLCDTFFNIPAFGYDGGDCCMASCTSTKDYDCGKRDSTAFGIPIKEYAGYPNCQDPKQKCDSLNEVCWKPSSMDLTGKSINAESGSSVALSRNGDIMAVAEPGAGRVRIFEQAGMQWAQRGQVLEGPTDDLKFGSAMALSKNGNVVAVGVTSRSSSYVQVFEWDWISEDWIRRGDDVHGVAAFFELSVGDIIGFSIALSSDGSILAVGSPGHNKDEWEEQEREEEHQSEIEHSGQGGTGRVVVYQYVGWWQQLGQDIHGGAKFDNAGISVALSGNGDIVAVGASQFQSTRADTPGYVGVYKIENYKWTQLGNLLNGLGPADQFGWTVALSHDGLILAVGDFGRDAVRDAVAVDSGVVRVYQFRPNVWMQLGSDLSGKGHYDHFGWSISLSSDGTILAVGAMQRSNVDQDDSGYLSVFKYDQNITQWIQHGQLVTDAGLEISGYEVSLSDGGEMMAIGAPFDSGKGLKGGRVSVYRNAGLAKVQTAPEGSLVPITISLQFDAFPDDIEVILRCEYATVAAFGRNTFSVPNELVVDTFRVPKAAKCQFTITDALSNGMCRSDGKGFYRVYYGNNTTNSSNILAQGGQLFGSREEVAFTSSPPLPALVPVTIVLQLDNHANEVAVFFHCGETIKSEAPLRSFTQDAGGLVSSTFFVEEGAECKFEITDNNYDIVNGLCCFVGYGFYQIYYGDDPSNQDSLIAQGGQFDHKDDVTFIVSPNSTVSAAGLVPCKVVVQLDFFIGQTGFSLQCGTDVLVSVAFTLDNDVSLPFERTYFVEDGTMCQFSVVDRGGDGICCDHGQGYVRIYIGGKDDEILIFDEGDFGYGTSINFTVSPTVKEPILSIDPVISLSDPLCSLCQDGAPPCYPEKLTSASFTVSFGNRGNSCGDADWFAKQIFEGAECDWFRSRFGPRCGCDQVCTNDIVTIP